MTNKKSKTSTSLLASNLLSLVILITLVMAQSCSKPAAAAGTGAEDPVFAVATTVAVAGDINDYIEINGEVESRNSVDVYPDTAGKLVNILVAIGQRVSKDQVIAEVDPSRPGTSFVASPVKSPISGTVTALPGQLGATVSPAFVIARIAATDRLQISTQIAERFISRIRVGLEAILTLEAYPGERFSARIIEISPVVDTQTRTMAIKLQPVNPDSRLRAGMFVGIKIVTERKGGVVKVPAAALVRRQDQTFVFIVKQDTTKTFLPRLPVMRAERRNVVVGIQIDNKLEILEGVTVGDEIVVQGQTLLEDRSRVRVVTREEGLNARDHVE